jgi:hypothetical protein
MLAIAGKAKNNPGQCLGTKNPAYLAGIAIINDENTPSQVHDTSWRYR